MARKKKPTRRKIPMAKRRGTRTVYRTAKRVYRRARGGLSMGTFTPIISGTIGGIAGNVAGNYLGGYGRPLAHAGVGYFMKDKALMTIAGMELGQTIFGGNGASTGGFFES